MGPFQKIVPYQWWPFPYWIPTFLDKPAWLAPQIGTPGQSSVVNISERLDCNCRTTGAREPAQLLQNPITEKFKISPWSPTKASRWPVAYPSIEEYATAQRECPITCTQAPDWSPSAPTVNPYPMPRTPRPLSCQNIYLLRGNVGNWAGCRRYSEVPYTCNSRANFNHNYFLRWRAIGLKLWQLIYCIKSYNIAEN